jgi:tripartite-type tricarboxylate transporter receptor subunit TctC
VPHIVIQPLALKNPGYGTQELQIAAITVGGPAALMVRKESPLKSLDDFVKFARKNPGELTVGGVETYSGSDLALAQVVGPADIEVKYVPITGGAEPVLSSLFGGHVDSAMISTPHAVQNSDRVRTLAVGGEERFKGLEDIPTFKEEGYDVTVSYAWGVAFPPGVPKEIVGRFGEATLTAMRESGAVEQVTQEGLLPLTMGPEEAEQYVQKQIPVYRELLPVLQRFSG